MRTLLLLAIAFLTLAGCGGSSEACPDGVAPGPDGSVADADGDCVADSTENTLGTDPNDDGSVPNLEDPGTQQQLGNATPAAEEPRAWSEESFTGDYTTAATLFPQAITEGQPVFTVPANASVGWFNITLTAQGAGEVNVRLFEPGCTTADCFHDQMTSGMAAAVEIAEPPEGEWRLSLFAAAASTGTYELKVNSLVPAA